MKQTPKINNNNTENNYQKLKINNINNISV